MYSAIGAVLSRSMRVFDVLKYYYYLATDWMTKSTRWDVLFGLVSLEDLPISILGGNCLLGV